MKYPTWFTVVIFTIAAAAGGRLWEMRYPWTPDTLGLMQIEFDAMRLCMQTAGKTGCRMTIQDFIRYHELKELLNISPPG